MKQTLKKKNDQIKMGDYIDRRVTLPTFSFLYFIEWGCL